MSLETCQIYSRKRQFYTKGTLKRFYNYYTMHKTKTHNCKNKFFQEYNQNYNNSSFFFQENATYETKFKYYNKNPHTPEFES